MLGVHFADAQNANERAGASDNFFDARTGAAIATS
jgi:hypothetical protein